jgi:hypothetical protein
MQVEKLRCVEAGHPVGTNGVGQLPGSVPQSYSYNRSKKFSRPNGCKVRPNEVQGSTYLITLFLAPPGLPVARFGQQLLNPVSGVAGALLCDLLRSVEGAFSSKELHPLSRYAAARTVGSTHR